MKDLILLLAVGRLVIWLISWAKPTQFVWKFFDHCDLCLGMWVYLAVALLLGTQIDLAVISPTAPVVWRVLVSSFNYVLTAMICTTSMWLMVRGFKEQFYAIKLS